MAKQEIGQSPILDPATPTIPAPAAPVYGPDGRLTYQSMIGIVRGGGSVTHKDREGRTRIINSVASLPSELEYASTGGDKSQIQNATQAQERRIAELQSELDRMKAAQGGANDKGPATENLDDLKVDELKDKAKAAGIENYSTMHKQDLIDALRKANK
jgi:hypothetical protein